MIPWPKSIVQELAKRQCVLFLGSGVSHNSINARGAHPKTWREFLLYGASQGVLSIDKQNEIKRKIECEDYLLACELLRKYLGRDSFNRLLVSEYQDPKFQHAAIHEAIFNLDEKIVLTPNFDQIYESYAVSESKSTVNIKRYDEADLASFIRDSRRLVLKIHGTISSPNTMIFTQMDYAKARNDNRDFYQLLNALIVTRTFLFLGAGLNDPDIRLLLENYAFQFQWSPKHFFVIPEDQLSPMECQIYSESLNLSFLFYNPANNHKELTDSLFELVKLVEQERDNIVLQRDW